MRNSLIRAKLVNRPQSQFDSLIQFVVLKSRLYLTQTNFDDELCEEGNEKWKFQVLIAENISILFQNNRMTFDFEFEIFIRIRRKSENIQVILVLSNSHPFQIINLHFFVYSFPFQVHPSSSTYFHFDFFLSLTFILACE